MLPCNRVFGLFLITSEVILCGRMWYFGTPCNGNPKVKEEFLFFILRVSVCNIRPTNSCLSIADTILPCDFDIINYRKMKCNICGEDKLSKEFVSKNVSIKCTHPPLHCMTVSDLLWYQIISRYVCQGERKPNRNSVSHIQFYLYLSANE